MHSLSIHSHFNPPSNKRIKWCQYLGPTPLKREWLQQQQEVSEIKPSPLHHVLRHCNVYYLLHSKSPPYLGLALFTRLVSSGFMELAKACQPKRYGKINCTITSQISQKWQETWNTGMHTWIIQVFNIKKRSNNKMPENKLKHSIFMWQIINWYQPICLATW